MLPLARNGARALFAVRLGQSFPCLRLGWVRRCALGLVWLVALLLGVDAPLLAQSGPDAPVIAPDAAAWVVDGTRLVTTSMTLSNPTAAALPYTLSVQLTHAPQPHAAVAGLTAAPRLVFPAEKIDPRLQWMTAQGGRQDGGGSAQVEFVEMLIFLAEQPDLTLPPGLDWVEQGRWVWAQLQQAAPAPVSLLNELDAAQAAGRVAAYRRFTLVNAIAVRGDPALVAGWAAQPQVAYIEALLPLSLPPLSSAGDAQAAAASAWGIQAIGADRVWRDFGVRGAGVVVGTIDTGVKWTHAALATSYRGGLYDSSGNRHSGNWFDATGLYPNSPDDNNGHGSHTMGTLAGGVGDGSGESIGVAPGARWIAAKGCGATSCSATHILAAAEWMLAPYPLGGSSAQGNPDLRPHVVNASWGGDGGSLWFEGMVNSWRAAGILPVFAAGNRGPNASTILSPADYAGSFAVGALDATGAVASFSGRGPSLVTGETKPDLVAPGVAIRSAALDGGYTELSGTSMAAPHAAGCAALIRSAAPWLALDAVEQAMTSTAAETGAVGPDAAGGFGRLDCYAALTQVHTVPWLAVGAPYGTLAAHAAQTVTITIDPRELAAGDYGVDLVLVSGAASLRQAVGVTLTVGATATPTDGVDGPDVPSVEPPDAAGLVRLSLPTTAAPIGAVTPVTLALAAISGTTPIYAVQFALGYDPAVMRPQAAAVETLLGGTLADGWQVSTHSPAPGAWRAALYGTTALPLAGTQTGNLLVLPVELIGAAGDVSALTLDAVLVNEGAPAAETTAGSMTLQPAWRGGTVRSGTSDVPLPGVPLVLSGVATDSVSTGADGRYGFGLPGLGAYQVTPGAPAAAPATAAAISALDAAYLVQCVVGARTGCVPGRADASGDGQLTAYDAALIARYVIGDADPAAAVGDWRFEPPFHHVDPAQPDAAYDFHADLVGDVTGNWGALAASPSDEDAPDNTPPQAVLTDALIQPGGTAHLSLHASTTVQAFSATVRVDPAQVAAVGAKASAADWTVMAHSLAPGVIRLAGYGVTPLAAGAPLAWLTVSGVPGAVTPGAVTPIHLAAVRLDEHPGAVETHDGRVVVGAWLYLPLLQDAAGAD